MVIIGQLQFALYYRYRTAACTIIYIVIRIRNNISRTCLGPDSLLYLVYLEFSLLFRHLVDNLSARIVFVGKEAVILHAESDPTCPTAKEPLPKECVLKIFKTTLAEFKQRDKYIKDDHRFKDRIGKQTSRKTINLWAEKEMANLMRLQRANIRCPSVVALKSHVLVMSFVGEDNRPAPKLKDAHMTETDYMLAYEEVTHNINFIR